MLERFSPLAGGMKVLPKGHLLAVISIWAGRY